MSAQITVTQAINRAIDEAMAEDEGVILLGEDVAAKQGGGVFKISSGLTEKYGEHRIRATPISETAIVGACVGAALTGFRPIAEIMLMNFVTVAMDHRQPCRETALHVGRADQCPAGDPHHDRRRRRLRRAA